MGSNNASLKNFRQANIDLVKRAGQNMHKAVLAQAEELKGNIQSAIAHNVTGTLRDSVRFSDRTDSKELRVTVLVMAGGATTTKNGFDYALAEEFGTTKQGPQPFFYHVARAYRVGGLEQFKETLEDTIKENEITRRVMRDSNYTMAAGQPQEVVISAGHRGALKVQTTKNGRQVG